MDALPSRPTKGAVVAGNVTYASSLWRWNSRPANVVNLMGALRRSVDEEIAARRQLQRRLKKRRLRSAQRKLLEDNEGAAIEVLGCAE